MLMLSSPCSDLCTVKAASLLAILHLLMTILQKVWLMKAVCSSYTVPPVYRVDFLCFLVFFVRSESYFLQYSSEKSQSWQECGQVTPHHNCIVKIY